MKSYLVHLIRNGSTKANSESRYIGHTDEPLSPEGRAELEKLTAGNAYPVADALLSSPLSRCVETARVLYPQMNPLVINGLIEYNFGEFEGKTAGELADHPLFPDWLAGKKDVVPPFGESNAEFAARVCGNFTSIVNDLIKTGTRSAVIVTHGGVIMTVLAAFGLPELPMHEWLSPAGGGYTARIFPSLWMRGQKFEVAGEIPAYGNGCRK